MKLAKAILQKAVTRESRYIFICVVDADILGLENSPEIMETVVQVSPGTIYNGMKPSISFSSMCNERADLKGLGIAGILTEEKWACVDVGKSVYELMSE